MIPSGSTGRGSKALDLDAERIRIALCGLLQLSPGFALQKIMHTPVEVFEFAGDTENAFAAVARFGPDRAAFAGAMHDPVRRCRAAE